MATMTAKQKKIAAKYPMVKLYAKQIEAEKITIDDVPSLWRAYVEDYLA